MGRVKAALFDEEQQQMMGVMRQRSAYMDMAFQMQAALELIERLSPVAIGQPDDAWGKVECYHEAKKIARQTLEAIDKEYGNGSK